MFRNSALILKKSRHVCSKPHWDRRRGREHHENALLCSQDAMCIPLTGLMLPSSSCSGSLLGGCLAVAGGFADATCTPSALFVPCLHDNALHHRYVSVSPSHTNWRLSLPAARAAQSGATGMRAVCSPMTILVELHLQRHLCIKGIFQA